jgi:F0F1-type ATP synthase delta subunit
MKHTTHDIAKAAIDAAYEMLNASGLEHEAARFAQDLRAELGSRGQTVHAVLITPSGDAGALAKTVQAALEKKLGHPVEMTEKADTSLLGGAILEYGDTRLDVSVRGALNDAKFHMESSTTH